MTNPEEHGDGTADPGAGRGGRSRLRTGLFRAAAVGFTLLLALVVLEIAARVLKLAPPGGPPNRTAIVLHYDDPNGMVRLTPSWQGIVSGQPTKINARGFRDRVFPATAPAGTVRIAVLGDSYTMGDGVPRDATYPKQIEALLAAEAPCEVMNCGVTATNTLQHLAILRELIQEYRPDIVVLGYNVNDFEYNRLTRFDRLTKAGFGFTVNPDRTVTLQQKEYTGFQKLKLWVRENSHLAGWALMHRDPKARATETPAQQVERWIEEKGHERSFDAVVEMKALCEGEGISFQVLVLPALLNVSLSVHSMADYPLAGEHRRILDELKRRGVACVDMVPAFLDRDPNELVLNRWDHHYNREGGAILAKEAARHLLPLVRKHAKR